MDVKQLKYFVACVQAGSISKAAKRLYTTQSAVSKTIKGLEEELGLSLFERLPRGISLTEQGRQVYFYAHKIVSDMDMLEAFPRSGAVKWLRISMNPSDDLAGQLAAFYREKQEKNYHFQVYTADVRTIKERVANHLDDIGFVYVPEEQIGIFSEELTRDRLAFVELKKEPMQVYPGKKHALSKSDEKEVSADDLKGCRLIQNYCEIWEGVPIWDDLEVAVITNSDFLMRRMLEETELINISGEYLEQTGGNGACGKQIVGDEKVFLFGCIVYKGAELSAEIKELISFLKMHLCQKWNG